MFWIEKKMSFCRAGLCMAKTNTLVDGKNLGNWEKNCVIVRDSFSNWVCRFIHGRFRFFFAWYTIKNGRGSNAVQGTFVYVFFLFFLFCLFSQLLFLRIKYEFDTINGLNPGVRFDCIVWSYASYIRYGWDAGLPHRLVLHATVMSMFRR